MAMTDSEIVALVEGEFSRAMGAPGGQISEERARAWNFYLSKPLGNEIEGQSQAKTSDVADVVDGVMPSMLRLFTTADNLVDFDPVSEEDEESASQESDYVNHVFFRQNPSFEILYTWFFDAFVQKNGVVKAWWDDAERVTRESYRGLNDVEIFELLDDPELEVIERSERSAETVLPDGTVGESIVHDVAFRRVSKSGRVRVGNVPPEEYRISADARSLDPSEARFVGHEREITRSELLAMGFDDDIVDSLQSHSDNRRSEEHIARRDRSDEHDDVPSDRSQDKILVREAYVRIDIDGSGKSELRQIFTAGGKLLANEPADRQPFHVLSPQPLPHKHFGRATAEKVMDVQEITTTLLRQTLDNLYHSNNPSHAVWEQGMGEHTLDDLLTTRSGSIKRFARPVGESWQPIAVPFTAGNSFGMLDFFEKVKRDRTGIGADSEGLNPEALKNIQTSVLAQAFDISRLKIEAIARIFAETGIKSLFRHIHELVLKHQDKPAVVRLRNKWIEVDPREWRTRENMAVNIGLGIGTREQNLLHLNAIWEKQLQSAQLGIVQPSNFFRTAAEIVKNANLKEASLFFSDPGDAEMPQQEDQQAQLAMVQAQLAMRQQELDAQKQSVDQQRLALQDQRDRDRIAVQRQKVENDLLLGLEQIRNKLTELELDAKQNVPGSRV